MSIKRRLQRLEGRPSARRVTFWDWLCGSADPEQLQGPDRATYENLQARPDGRDRPNPIAERLRQVGSSAATDVRNVLSQSFGRVCSPSYR